MQAPDIDTRSYADIVAQTGTLAGQLSGWQSTPGDAPDGGSALIGVFGRFAELVIARLNRAPDKNYLAFLNLIGAAQTPPRVARGPLTFQLATGSPVDATVPAGTLAAAPPLAGETDDVVFETEQLLVVTRSQLQAAFVSDTEADTYSDRTAEATGVSVVDQPFAVFAGDQPSPHQLFVACDPLLTQPGGKNVVLTGTTPDTWQWQNWPVSWAYFDGASWQPAAGSGVVASGRWQVTLTALPALVPVAVNGITAGWLRAQLDLPLPPEHSGLVPESAATGAKNPADVAFPLAPFPADSSVQRFYLSADEAFEAGGAQLSLQVNLAQAGAGTGLALNWFYQANSQWLPLGQSSDTAEQAGSSDFEFSDGTLGLTRSGVISFRLPMAWPLSLYRSRTGRWLRVDLASGQYTTPPQIGALTAGYDWQLPQLGAVTVAVATDAAASPVPPAAAFSNATGLDLSKDFYPFGMQPQFNDTCYVACPDALARPGAVLVLSVTLTNPPGSSQGPPAVSVAHSPVIAWEVCDGSSWQAAAVNYAFTSNGQVSLTLPDPLVPAMVNGQPGYWLRARLVGGSYGGPASYTQDTSTTPPSYTYQAADFAPPVIKTLTITAAAAAQPPVPVTAGLTFNDFGYTDVTASAGAAAGPLFTPFTPTADTDPALYLGFDQPFSQRPVTLFLEVEAPSSEQVTADQLAQADPAPSARLSWEYASPTGWSPVSAADETQGLSRRDLVTLIGPADLTPRSCFGQSLCWLRLRWSSGDFPIPPQLRRVLLNTTWASQVSTVADEILGSSNGGASQTVTAAQNPVQPGQQLTVREPQPPPAAEVQALEAVEGTDAVTVTLDAAGQPEDIWVRWHAVPDFYESGPRDRHYTIDPLSGVITFGDGSFGLIPPIGANNLQLTYRTGGGEQGNRDSATIIELKSSVPYIDGVTNNEPSAGGAPTEPIETVQARGPAALRHRDRAVAAQDLEDLALAASADVATAAAIVPIFNPYSLWLDPQAPVPTADHLAVDAGQMGVIIVPDEPGSARPTPSLVLLSQVQQYLQQRCPPTAGLWVAGPEWIAVTVTATLVVSAVADADPAADQARTALDGYLHPLTGAPGGQGWPLGIRPHASDLTAVLAAVAGVDHVGTISVTYVPQTADPENLLALQRILARPLTEPSDAPERERDLTDWLDRALVYSGPHQITVALAAPVAP